MKKQFKILLLFTILIVVPSGTIKAVDIIKITTTNTEFRNVIETSKDIIRFTQENIFVIIFLIWLVISIKRAIHNYTIKKKYKRDNNKYEIKRNKEEGDERDRHTIYLVCKEKNNEGKIEYHHIINTYTMTKLDYTRPSRKDEYCFSTKDEDFKNFKMGKNIIIYNITFDFRKIDN